MIIPREVEETLDTNGVAFSHYTARYLREYDSIKRLLLATRFEGLGTVVDYGCGLGGWTWPMAEIVKDVVGVDISRPYIDTARKIAEANKLTNTSFICAPNLRNIASGSADGIISLNTLQVVGTGDFWHDFFEDAARILRPNGRLLVNFASPFLPLEFLLRGEGFRNSLRFAVSRNATWAKNTVKGVLTTKIERGKRYYAIRKAVAGKISRQYGFQEADGGPMQQSLRQHKIESFNKGRLPQYIWMVYTKI